MRVRRRRCRGVVSAMVMIILMLTFLGAMTILGASATQVQQTVLSQNRLHGLALAEAGVEDAVDRVKADTSYMGGSDTVYEDPGTNSKAYGTFTTQVTKLNDTNWKVVSTGTNPNSTTRQVVALLEKKTRPLGSAAIMANGDVDIGGNADVVTVPSGYHTADVFANGDITAGGSSVVDGTLVASGNVSGAGYYPSVSGSEPLEFPNAVTTEAWRTAWITKAQTGGTTNVPGNGRLNGTYNGSRYFEGDVSLKSSDTVTFNGTGNDVVYINGNVDMAGQSVILNKVTLIIAGTFTQTGGTLYSVDISVKPTPTLVVYGAGVGAGDDSVKLAGGSSTTQRGIVWTINGCLNLVGNSAFTGAWIVSGLGSSAKLPASYDHYFPTDMTSSIAFNMPLQVKYLVEL